MENRTKRALRLIFFTAVIIAISASPLMAEPFSLPTIKVGVDKVENPEEMAVVLQILFLLTILSLAPAILIMLTSFMRVVVVLSFLRHAMGTQQMPPNQIIVGLALFLTFFIMSPVWGKINTEALQPYLAHRLTQEEALKTAIIPLRDFMLKQTRERDLALFVSFYQKEKPRNPEEIPLLTLIPSFIISELKTAFEMGFLIYMPFVVIDMVLASVLLSMGMMMLPPMMISLPFKLIMFVLVDGWHLIVGSLVNSFA